ncbi:MAG: hypothetical protein K2J85_06800, partial [Anaeroplasmataceae bacterium]|nr:hypothetical protein [Anaeroplasmataceae bacterium]
MKKIRYLFVMVFVIILCSCMNDPNDKKLEILQEATEQWQEFVNSNQLTITAEFTVSLKLENEDVSLGNETSQTEVKLCKSPFYMETKENDEILVVQEEQGELYKYTFPVSPGMVYVNKSLVEDIDYIDNITDDYYTEDPFSGIDIKHIGVAYNQNIYTFRMNVYDYLQTSGATEETKNIIASLGGDASMLKNSWLTISMSFSDTAAYMKLEMEFRHEGLVVLIEIDTKLDNREIFKVDFNDPKYFVAPPSDIEDVHQFSNVGENINVPMFGTNYFKFNLEKGQYGLYASLLDEESNSDFDDWTINNIFLKLYDENFEEIPIGMGLSPHATAFPQRTFYISEPGIYYLSAQSNISTEMKISINQLDYKTIGFESTQEFISGKGTIEGEYDFDVYTLEAEEDGLILFKNIGESPIYLIYCEYISNGSPHITYEKIIDETYIRLGAGENKFIVCSNFKFNQQPLEYEFTTER